MSEPSTEVVLAKSSLRFDDETLRAMTADSALSLSSAPLLDLSTVLGSGFRIATKNDKLALCGKRFMIVQWQQINGDKGLYTSLLVLTEDSQKWVINDGGSGINQQVAAFKDHPGMILVNGGLRRSEYWMNPKDNSEKSNHPVDETWEKAETYYLNP